MFYAVELLPFPYQKPKLDDIRSNDSSVEDDTGNDPHGGVGTGFGGGGYTATGRVVIHDRTASVDTVTR